MAKAKQVLDVRVSKGITTSQSNEHQRRWTEKGWEQALEKGNYDPSREHLNFEIVSGKVRPVDKSRSIPERDVGRDKSMLSCNLQRQFKKESVFKGSYHRGKTGGTTGFGRIPGVQ